MANSKISVENLNLHYGENHALKNVNMEIADHAITAFIGPSGCGKSTFLRCLNRMNDLVDGCRVEGKVILDGNRVRGMKYISCINVRLAHEIQGCAGGVMPYIQTREQIMHTLIVSPPRCGKTTLLRDIIRQMSNGWGDISGVTVGVVDERSELAGCYQGIPQNDLGMRTDILDGCPKAEGMQMLIRSMSPVVVAVDELGKEEDFKAVEAVIHCGCRLIATAHGDSVEETLSQPFFQKLWEARVFQRYIFLGKHDRAGIVEGIYDGNGKCLCTEL